MIFHNVIKKGRDARRLNSVASTNFGYPVNSTWFFPITEHSRHPFYSRSKGEFGLTLAIHCEFSAVAARGPSSGRLCTAQPVSQDGLEMEKPHLLRRAAPPKHHPPFLLLLSPASGKQRQVSVGSSLLLGQPQPRERDQPGAKGTGAEFAGHFPAPDSGRDDALLP